MLSRRLLGVLLGSFLLSCVVAFLSWNNQAHYNQGGATPEWLYLIVALAYMPGEFVAMINKGMCNTRTAGGYTIAIAVNTLFYFVPVLVMKAIIETHLRKRKRRDDAS